MWLEILVVDDLVVIMLFLHDLSSLLNLLQLLGSNDIAWPATSYWPGYGIQLMIEHASK